MNFALVILAGGQGSRIGGDKPKRILGGRTLLDRAEKFTEGLSDCRAVAVRDAGQAAGTSLPIIKDDVAIEGPLAGLVAALRFARTAGAVAVLTIPVDMPFLPGDLGERLGEALGQGRTAIASSGGHLHPVCGLWAVEALALVPDYLASGKRSLTGFALAAGLVAVDWPADPLDPFFNINSDEDLVEAERLLGILPAGSPP